MEYIINLHYELLDSFFYISNILSKTTFVSLHIS